MYSSHSRRMICPRMMDSSFSNLVPSLATLQLRLNLLSCPPNSRQTPNSRLRPVSNTPTSIPTLSALPLRRSSSRKSDHSCDRFGGYWLLCYSRYQGLEADEARAATLYESLVSKLKVYEQILGKQKYLAGDVSILYYSCDLISLILFCH